MAISKNVLTAIINDKATQVVDELIKAEQKEFGMVYKLVTVQKQLSEIEKTRSKILGAQSELKKWADCLDKQTSALTEIFRARSIDTSLNGSTSVSQYNLLNESFSMEKVDIELKPAQVSRGNNSTDVPRIHGATPLAQKVMADFRKEVLRINVAIETLGRKELKTILDDFAKKKFI